MSDSNVPPQPSPPPPQTPVLTTDEELAAPDLVEILFAPPKSLSEADLALVTAHPVYSLVWRADLAALKLLSDDELFQENRRLLRVLALGNHVHGDVISHEFVVDLFTYLVKERNMPLTPIEPGMWSQSDSQRHLWNSFMFMRHVELALVTMAFQAQRGEEIGEAAEALGVASGNSFQHVFDYILRKTPDVDLSFGGWMAYAMPVMTQQLALLPAASAQSKDEEAENYYCKRIIEHLRANFKKEYLHCIGDCETPEAIDKVLREEAEKRGWPIEVNDSDSDGGDSVSVNQGVDASVVEQPQISIETISLEEFFPAKI